MSTKPDYCAGCGRPTQSHNVAIDVSEHDNVGLPTLAGVCCHRCWSGDSDGVPPIGDLLQDVQYDDERGERAEDKLVDAMDFDEMVAISAPVEALRP